MDTTLDVVTAVADETCSLSQGLISRFNTEGIITAILEPPKLLGNKITLVVADQEKAIQSSTGKTLQCISVIQSTQKHKSATSKHHTSIKTVGLKPQSTKKTSGHSDRWAWCQLCRTGLLWIWSLPARGQDFDQRQGLNTSIVTYSGHTAHCRRMTISILLYLGSPLGYMDVEK